ncbi:DUF397 domain-containing protein [Streptomyces verrucosisporus]|uniref:DUF397 domain-containing protein n=1 Tax=Streptomyces verrucosisporus TaxID=1695161 RepID=UPI0019D1DB36|nr:DUF397 domain-containing protein [Streptomyces verrucosisporus]MBN3932059.1 DUF397 domain-containing protein [Streptomyces verrucosisporus]
MPSTQHHRADELESAHWFKSSHSGGQGLECVEIAFLTDQTAVRDSKGAGGPVLRFPAGAWETFLGGVKAHGGRGRELC